MTASFDKNGLYGYDSTGLMQNLIKQAHPPNTLTAFGGCAWHIGAILFELIITRCIYTRRHSREGGNPRSLVVGRDDPGAPAKGSCSAV